MIVTYRLNAININNVFSFCKMRDQEISFLSSSGQVIEWRFVNEETRDHAFELIVKGYDDNYNLIEL